MKKLIGLVVLIFFLSVAAASAGKNSYAPTLTVTPGSGTNYVVLGCGYNADYGEVGVVVTSPDAVAFVTQAPNANGCIYVTNFSTLSSGHYVVDAWQTVKKKAQVVAETSFDV